MAGKNFDKYSAIFSPENPEIFSTNLWENPSDPVIQEVLCDVIQGETVWGDNGWEEVNISSGRKVAETEENRARLRKELTRCKPLHWNKANKMANKMFLLGHQYDSNS